MSLRISDFIGEQIRFTTSVKEVYFTQIKKKYVSRVQSSEWKHTNLKFVTVLHVSSVKR